MAKQDFIPDRDNDYLAWDDNLVARLAGGLGTKYNISSTRVTAAQTENTDLHTKATDATAKKTAAKSSTATYRTKQRTVKGNRRALAREIKGQPNYDPADGILMGIEGPEDTTDLTHAKPTLRVKGSPVSGHVHVDFDKSVSDGVRIESRRGSESGFSFLATDTFPDYDDTRPNLGTGPETRQYRAQYILGDDPIGEMSEILTVTVPAASPTPPPPTP